MVVQNVTLSDNAGGYQLFMIRVFRKLCVLDKVFKASVVLIKPSAVLNKMSSVRDNVYYLFRNSISMLEKHNKMYAGKTCVVFFHVCWENTTKIYL